MSNDPHALCQINCLDGTPNQAQITGDNWIHDGQIPFAAKTDGNIVKAFTTGVDYYANLATALKEAENCIYIAGWQVNWDINLTDTERLFDVILNACQSRPELKVYIMPWSGMFPETHLDVTERVFTVEIEDILGRKQVYFTRSKGFAQRLPILGLTAFSHHQKFVVVDRKIAFIGGIDLAYGRRGDISYSLDPSKRKGFDRYNGCVAPVREPDHKEGLTLRKLLEQRDEYGQYQVNHNTRSKLLNPNTYYISDSKVLDDHQPQLPWQDVHCRIEGPSAMHIANNFIQRWNCHNYWHKLAYMDEQFIQQNAAQNGTCQVQVIRSASKAMMDEEQESNNCKAAGKPRLPNPDRHQDNIYQAMLNLIHNAEHFIYLENQFFVSDFAAHGGYEDTPEGARGQVPDLSEVTRYIYEKKSFMLVANAVGGGSQKDMPQNQIVQALARKLQRVIFDADPRPFHVYIVLPIHSEGALNDPTITAQVHLTMQTLSLGKKSLLNRIRYIIAAKKLMDAHPDDPSYTEEACMEKVQGWPIETLYDNVSDTEVDQFITILNLRNWGVVGGNLVTEQIYIHTKVTIVDDRHVIIGSANINDRSLTGNGDSELSVLISDTASEPHALCDGPPTLTLNFARQLRLSIWEKWLGFAVPERAAPVHLKTLIKTPAHPACSKAIQQLAKTNSKAYEAVFPHIPKNIHSIDGNMKKPSSIWPSIPATPAALKDTIPTQEEWENRVTYFDNKGKIDPITKTMPFSEEFWDKSKTKNSTEQEKTLKSTAGFITAFPQYWTKGENNHFPFETGIVG